VRTGQRHHASHSTNHCGPRMHAPPGTQ
jgi:hypothetical protein